MSTVKRYAYAMHIAGRPDLHRKEYAKKLYKNLSESLPTGNPDTILRLSTLLANSSKLSPEQITHQLEVLRTTLKPIQQQRQANRRLQELIKEYPLDEHVWVWRITDRRFDYNPRTIDVEAQGKQAALAQLPNKVWPWSNYDQDERQQLQCVPVRPVINDSEPEQDQLPDQEQNGDKFEIYNSDTGASAMVFRAPDHETAMRRIAQYRQDHPGNSYRIRPYQVGTNSSPRWRLVSSTTGDTVYEFHSPDQRSANETAQRYIDQNSGTLSQNGQGTSFNVLVARD
jgi:hypothetical protein